MDKNKDGQIALYEWDRSKYAEFKRLDKNHDGILTPQELVDKSAVAATTTSTTSTTSAKEGEVSAKPAPTNLNEYKDKINESFTFMLTGKIGGQVWGTDIYSTDSNLAAAAVHAGILKEGASGQVRVTIIESPIEFAGTDSYGVESDDRIEKSPAFRFLMP